MSTVSVNIPLYLFSTYYFVNSFHFNQHSSSTMAPNPLKILGKHRPPPQKMHIPKYTSCVARQKCSPRVVSVLDVSKIHFAYEIWFLKVGHSLEILKINTK